VPQFYTYTLTGAIAFSALFAYVSASPKVFMNVFQVSEKTYGWIFAALSVGFIGSSQVNTLLLRRFTSEQILPVALAVQSVTGLIFVTGVLNGWLGLWATLVLLFILLCCLGFVNPNTAALSLAPFERNAGSASSLMGALQMGAGALASVFVSLDERNSALPLALVMTGTGMLALAVLLTCRRNIGAEPIEMV
jgi:DHA1 family bicyclomycin/chloramphenicol resistance-like MFS transporter